MPSTVPSPNSYSLRICSNSSTFAFLSIPRLLLLQQDASGLRGGPFYSIEMGRFRVSKSLPFCNPDPSVHYQIQTPLLTPHEKRYLDAALPAAVAAELYSQTGIPEQDINKYASVYRYFPSFIVGE